MWSYIAAGHRKLPFGTKSSGLIIKYGLKIRGQRGTTLYITSSIEVKFINRFNSTSIPVSTTVVGVEIG